MGGGRTGLNESPNPSDPSPVTRRRRRVLVIRRGITSLLPRIDDGSVSEVATGDGWGGGGREADVGDDGSFGTEEGGDGSSEFLIA